MGVRSSRGIALNEPLLPLHHQVHPVAQGLAPSGAAEASGSASAPASFKAGKPRKTKDFIGDEIILRSSSRPLWEAPTDVDPRLLDEERTMQAISEQVASLLSRYVEEGRSKQQDKDEDEFHEDHFLRRRFCSCCPFFRSRVPNPSKETILVFLNKIAESLYFCKQVVVLCAIYIERLLQRTDTVLTPGNWRSLVTAGMLISSKVWEDIHPWNADFEECLVEIAGIRYRNGALYRLESLFLEKLQWRVFVDGEIYAAYFFSLQEGRHSVQSSAGPRARKTQRLQRHHSDVSNFAIMPIIEDEPLVESETDIEKALASPHNLYEFSGSTMSTDSSVSQGSHVDPDLPKHSGETLQAIRSCWRLDAGNPHIGSLRHAPRALAPSKHIQQSEELLWAHKLAAKTTELFGHRKGSYPEAHTLSGATGNQLQTELLQYLSKKRGEDKTSKKDGARAGEITLNMLEEKSLWSEAMA